MQPLTPLLLVLLASAAAHQTAASALVEHSLDLGSTFATAGHIHLNDGDAAGAVFEREPFTSSQLSQLQQLVESDRLYLWRVKLPDQPPVLTSIKATCLAAALTSPHYALHLDAAGHIMSAQISVPAAATPGGSCSTTHALQALKALPSSGLSSLPLLDVSVHTPKPGPAVPQQEAASTPDLMAAAGAAQQQAQQQQQQQRRPQQQQQQQQQRQAGAAGAEGGSGAAEGGEGGSDAPAAPPVDERTWLQKNWLIALAGGTMVLNMVLKHVVDPQQMQAAQAGRQVQRRAA